jgi:acetoin utilization deacetylase AcuC-like enzyme
MKTAIIANSQHMAHDEPSHVERAARLLAIGAALDASGLRPDLLALAPEPASEAQLRAVHQST